MITQSQMLKKLKIAAPEGLALSHRPRDRLSHFIFILRAHQIASLTSEGIVPFVGNHLKSP